MRKIYFFLYFALLTLSCTEETEVHPATYSDLLTGGSSKSWQLISTQGNLKGALGVDTVNFGVSGAPCRRDDVLIFHKQGKVLEVNEGSTKCNEDDENTIASGTWNLNPANRKIFLGSSDFKLVELTDKKLVISSESALSFNSLNKAFPAEIIETYISE